MTDLFEELRQDGEVAIDRWIANKQGETLYFECKIASSRPGLVREDRATLAKLLSAFANSEGGLLLWGVDAHEVDGIDCLVDKQPIAQIAAFKSAVEHAIADVISPPILNIELLAILSSQREEAGYLAISVPSSDRRPHMSRSKIDPGFYFRNGHQSILMEPFQVRDQMLRRVAPRLEFEWDTNIGHVSVTNAQRGIVPISFNLVLRNNSFVSARFPYLILRVDRGRYIGMGTGYREIAEHGLSIAQLSTIKKRPIVVSPGSVSQDFEFAGDADCCIHPGTSLRIAAVELLVGADTTIYAGSSALNTMTPRFAELPTVIMEVSYGCLDAPCERVPLEVNADQMHAKLFSLGLAGPICLPRTIL